ncbi:PHP domain-containing protein [Oceanispirochaeta sp.]|jgi:PHP family Zn ribbon phosphoesterase|uniref:PHP domain-containing protein n=1 Tax=Oceanispirochaeta sp. TaxID=2035350 RepID=UPI0026123037|nr:PHP domain-containing protein [Oceanispirochaeta sp.]MDA3957407.1 PHP domain-containing protein [Oceanispirochaeta sp.]
MLIDLHNHSCLSPCASLEMSPSRLVKEATARGIGMLALTDHNAGDNLPAFDICCRRNGILPVFGLEVTSREEAHLLCLFGNLKTAVQFGYIIYENLMSIPNNPEKMGDQIIVDENENILGELEMHLAGGAVDFSIEELITMVHDQDGLFIPAHIDRAAFSIKSQLGFLPDNDYDAVEVMNRPSDLNGGRYFEITGSDAHYPENVGQRCFEINLPAPTFSGLIQALHS